MKAQQREPMDKVVQWHWQSTLTLTRDPREETAVSVGSPDTSPRTAGETGKHNAASEVRRVNYTGMQETKGWRQSWVSGIGYNIGYTRRGILGYSLTQWWTAGMLVDSGCADHIVATNDAFLDFVPIPSLLKNPKERFPESWAEAMWGSASPQIKGKSNAKSRKSCVWLTIPDTSYQPQDARSGHIASLSRKKSCMKVQKGTRLTLKQENDLFYLPVAF